MQDMCKFFVYTRGRTGSTAIIDEMNKHPDITCWQELFIAFSDDPIMVKFYEMHGARFSDYGIKMYWRPTYELWKKQFRKIRIFNKNIYINNKMLATESIMVRQYLEETENLERARHKKAVGFKLLQNQAEKIPGLDLFGILRRSQYKAIYLERVNVVKRVISGMIASKRKRYNALNYQQTNDAYTLDLDEFQSVVKYELKAVDLQKTMLKKTGFKTLYVTYEEFLENREEFYRKVFDFLEIDYQLPDKTGYSIMIPSVNDVVENYEELLSCVKDMGFEEML